MKKSLLFAISVTFCFLLILKSNAQTFETLDEQLITAFKQNFPDWKLGNNFQISWIGTSKDNNVWMTIEGQKGQKRLNISVRLHQSKKKASEDLDRSFRLAKITPRLIEMPKIGDKALTTDDPRYKIVNFLKENITVYLSITFRRSEKETKRDDTAALESEFEFLIQVAKLFSDNIVGEKTVSFCQNDFYKYIFPLKRTNEEKLLAAAYRGQPQKVKNLITQGVNLNFADTTGETALHYAIRSECFETVKILTEAKAEVNIKNKKGETPLMLATKHGNLETVKILLESGADPQIKSESGMSALNYALNSPKFIGFYNLASRDKVQILRILRGTGINLSDKNLFEGSTALIIYLQNRGLDEIVMKEILSYGIGINEKDSSNETALFKAVRFLSGGMRTYIINFLLQNGADVSLKNDQGMSVLNILREEEKLYLNNQNKQEDYKNLKETLKLLIESGAKE